MHASLRPPLSWTLLILAIALALRLYGLGFGLSMDDIAGLELGSQRDERAMAQAVLDGPLSGSADPGIFLHWGSGGFWTFGAVDAAVVGLASLSGHGDLTQTWRENPSGLLLLHRLVSAIAGVLTVLVLMSAAARERGPRVSLCAGALLATCYLHVRLSHAGSLDVLMTLWVTVAFDQSLRWLAAARTHAAGGHRHALAAGAAVGLATATKSTGAATIGLLLLAWWLARRARSAAAPGEDPAGGGGDAQGARLADEATGLGSAVRPLVSALLAAAGTFLLLSPHLLWSLDEALALMRDNGSRFAASPGDVPSALIRHLTHSLGVGFGWVALTLAAVGLGTLLRRREARGRELALLTLWPVVFLAIFRLTATRYTLPIVPGLCLLAAIGAESLAQRLGHSGPRRAAQILGALLLLAIALPLVRSVSFGRLLQGVDTRLDVAAALREAGAAHSDVLAFGLYGLPARVRSSDEPPMVVFLRLRQRRGPEIVQELRLNPPRFLLHERSHEDLDRLGWDLFADLVELQYDRVLSVDGRIDGATPKLPDENSGNPAFFVPWARPWLMRRPGPALDLYRRRAR